MGEIQEKPNKNEDYLVKCIGNFGIWQAIMCLLVATMRLNVTWNTLSIFFLTPTTTFVCKEFVENSSIANVENATCYQGCADHHYENDIFDENLISQFGLVCQRAWLASFAQSSLMFGLLIGTNLFGWVADRFGRRKALFIAIFFNSLSQLGASYSVSYLSFTIFRVCAGISTGGILVVTTVIIIEFSGPKYRSITGCLMSVLENGGQVSLVLFAYYTDTWSQMMFAIAIASSIFLLFFVVIPEVPRWLVLSGRTDDAVDILSKAAKWNRRSTENIPTFVKQMYNELSNANPDSNKKYGWTALFSTRKLCVRSVALCVIWWVVGIGGYGLNQYTSFIGENTYITVMVSGAASMGSPVLAAVLTKVVGRKLSLVGALLLAAILMVALAFASKDHWSSTVLAILGNCCFAFSFATLYLFTPELYPTPIRNRGLGLASSGSKLGAMIAPFVASKEPRWIPSVIFSILPIIALATCYVLPETKDKPLEDTIEE